MSSRKRQQRAKKPANRHAQRLNRVQVLERRLIELETRATKLGVHIDYSAIPDAELKAVPMLGHHKGNTKSNRKLIKRQQEELLAVRVAYIARQLKPHPGDSDTSSEKETSSSELEFGSNSDEFEEDWL